MADDESPYEIGYRKPPEYTRFRKGQPSPNPKGRPRKNKQARHADQAESDRLFREALDQEVNVRDALGVRKMTKRQALDEKHVNLALAGNSYALQAVRKEAREVEAREAERSVAQAEAARERFESMLRFRKERQQVWDAADKSNAVPAEPWPHPDDILVDEARQAWQVRGPFDESGVPHFEWVMAHRDACFTQALIASRERALRAQVPTIWDLCWRMHDKLLPLRWQIAPNFDRAWLGHGRHSLRELRRFAQDCLDRAAELEIQLGYRRTKEGYRFANTVLKPVLKQMGYRSLAELEHSNEGKPR